MDSAGAGSFLEEYLSRLGAALQDERVVELAINPDGAVFLERLGQPHMEPAGVRLDAPVQERLARAICAEAQAAFSDKAPIISTAVKVRGQNLRAQVVGPPAVLGGPAISLRKYVQSSMAIADIGLLHGELVDLESRRASEAQAVRDLIAGGEMAAAWQRCIDARLNIPISGGTSSGKTTFARALLGLVDPRERVLTVEDSAEIHAPQPNSVQLICERKDGSARSSDLLLQSTLRMRPDRIILGELRAGEAKTFLEAINTGHGGSFTTLHAETAARAIERLALMVLSTGIAMPYESVVRYCRQSIDVVVQLGRQEGRRGVVEICSAPSPELYETEPTLEGWACATPYPRPAPAGCHPG
ncbi:type II secretion system protein E [Haematobacter genomosp. 1]|uniref:Type II secretion system protein E n=1 Tax=Haematobacter genomosp. 1 TaxID=366618 RepID=A0A212AAG6_9RHOB|nr:type II secretion system protein E [Haematobacter genomosp. 1]